MEKQFRKQSSKHGNSSNKIISKSNKNLYMSKLREAKNSLEHKAKEIIVPVMKIQKKLSLKFDFFTKDYNEIIKKADTANKEIITHLEENKNDTMNITDIQLNHKYANTHENMIKFYEQVTNKLELFTNLINSDGYENLLKEFDKVITDKDLLNGEDSKEILEKFEKNCLVLKKNTKKVKKTNFIGTNLKKIVKRVGVKEKDKKVNRKEIVSKHKKHDRDLLDILQEEYKDNNYVQKISKTFLRRRLFKNIIYRNIFSYKDDGTIDENKSRSAGESTIYKYGKFTFKFKNDEFNQDIFDKLVKFIEEELKQCFTKINDEDKEYIISGKIGCLINDFLNKKIRINLYNDYNIVYARIEFYEFYEELVYEFNEKESNVKIINCDEKILANLKKDWESLKLVRNFVSKTKFNGKNIDKDIESKNNENNNDNIINNNENENENENMKSISKSN